MATATATTIYLTPKQRKGLFARARRHKSTFSEELRSALDMYLDLPDDVDAEALDLLAREAKAAAERSAARLDATIELLNSTARKMDEFQRRIDGAQ
jgi:hypothetical protein